MLQSLLYFTTQIAPYKLVVDGPNIKAVDQYCQDYNSFTIDIIIITVIIFIIASFVLLSIKYPIIINAFGFLVSDFPSFIQTTLIKPNSSVQSQIQIVLSPLSHFINTQSSFFIHFEMHYPTIFLPQIPLISSLNSFANHLPLRTIIYAKSILSSFTLCPLKIFNPHCFVSILIPRLIIRNDSSVIYFHFHIFMIYY